MYLLRSLAIALILAGCAQFNLYAAERHPRDVLLKNWVSLKLGFSLLGDDYYFAGPTVLLERLPGNRILLSYAKEQSGAEKKPSPIRDISDSEFAELVARVDAIWQKAQADSSEGERVSRLPRKEQIEIRRKPHVDLSVRTMKIEFKASDPLEQCVFEKTISACTDEWVGLLVKSGVPQILSINRALKGPWRSLKLSSFLDGGDHVSFGPCILIQRLPDKRLVLSYAKMDGVEKPVVPWGFVSEEEVSQIVTQTGLFWEKAKKEFSAAERIAKLPPAEQEIVNRTNRGSTQSESTMKVEISTSDQNGDAVFVETIEESADDWRTFLTKAAGTKR